MKTLLFALNAIALTTVFLAGCALQCLVIGGRHALADLFKADEEEQNLNY